MVGAYERAKDFVERVHSGIITKDSSDEQASAISECATESNPIDFSGKTESQMCNPPFNGHTRAPPTGLPNLEEEERLQDRYFNNK